MTSYHVPLSVRSGITSHNKWRMCKDEANTVVKFVSLELPYQVLHKRGGDILFLTHRCCVGFHARFSLRLRKKRKTLSSLLTSDFGEINAREIRGTTSTRVKCSPNFARASRPLFYKHSLLYTKEQIMVTIKEPDTFRCRPAVSFQYSRRNRDSFSLLYMQPLRSYFG